MCHRHQSIRLENGASPFSTDCFPIVRTRQAASEPYDRSMGSRVRSTCAALDSRSGLTKAGYVYEVEVGRERVRARLVEQLSQLQMSWV